MNTGTSAKVQGVMGYVYSLKLSPHKMFINYKE